MNTSEKLKQLALSEGVDSNLIRVAFAHERIVARISIDGELSESLTFKGGYVLFRTLDNRRFTRDLDALGTKISTDRLKKILPTALSKELEDGIRFHNIETEDLMDSKQYKGLRVNLQFEIAPFSARRTQKNLPWTQFDIGIGDYLPDDVTPTSLRPLIEGDRELSWRIYPLELIFAEKLHALLTLSLNSRAKDVFDLVSICPRVEMEKLRATISRTFKVRSTSVPENLNQAAEQVEITRLRSAWNSLRFRGDADFEEYWQQLLEFLSKVDST